MGAITVAVVSGVQRLWPSSDTNAIILHCHVNTMIRQCVKLVLLSPLTYVHRNGLLFQLQKPRCEIKWVHLLIGLCSQWPSRKSNSGPGTAQSQVTFQSSTSQGDVSELKEKAKQGFLQIRKEKCPLLFQAVGSYTESTLKAQMLFLSMFW